MFFGKICSKRADLSLSTNAIVILILAITILGLGLTFVRGLFQQAESKILEVSSTTELANPPTRDNPITLAPSQIKLRNNEQKKVTLAFLNDADNNRYCRLTVLTKRKKDVMSDNTAAASNNPRIQNLVIYNKEETLMNRDGINIWTLAVDGSKIVPFSGQDSKGTFLLTASMCCAEATGKLAIISSGFIPKAGHAINILSTAGVGSPGSTYAFYVCKSSGTVKRYQFNRDLIAEVTE